MWLKELSILVLLNMLVIYRISLNNSPGVYFLQRILIPGYKTRQASIKLMYCGAYAQGGVCIINGESSVIRGYIVSIAASYVAESRFIN